ncbi:DUF3842 family protein [Desulfoglaeba alkanexedens]|uniref:DUF3842 family protein n=1 Tax=Desulfoglaeba alkanexedens TaxID=361111 RepID=UPI001FE9B3F2|nr:DUF3842 family protein [Desulfoglaeba alkanexedens]
MKTQDQSVEGGHEGRGSKGARLSWFFFLGRRRLGKPGEWRGDGFERREPGWFSGKRGRKRVGLKRICVIDGQGGGIGATLIKYIKEAYGESLEVLALGTNAIATSQMMRAGANRGATGESAICWTVRQADCVIGPVAITWANAMLGEVTPRVAEAVMSCPSPKILLPLTQERVVIVGVGKEPLPHLVQALVQEKLKEVLEDV